MARMTKKKALWWLESLSRNYGGSLHKQAVEVIRAELAEARPIVRAKRPVQLSKPAICSAHVCAYCDKEKDCLYPYSQCLGSQFRGRKLTGV